MKRVLISGLVAGLVLNIGEAALHGGVLAQTTADALKALGRTDQGTPIGLTSLVLITFLQGIVGMRLFSHWPSAVSIGLILWFLSSLYSGVYLWAGFPDLLPTNLVWIPVAWGIVEYPLAMLAGAAVYRKLS